MACWRHTRIKEIYIYRYSSEQKLIFVLKSFLQLGLRRWVKNTQQRNSSERIFYLFFYALEWITNSSKRFFSCSNDSFICSNNLLSYEQIFYLFAGFFYLFERFTKLSERIFLCSIDKLIRANEEIFFLIGLSTPPLFEITRMVSLNNIGIENMLGN